jgi:N-acetylglucosamine-6-phosphate deacetylase
MLELIFSRVPRENIMLITDSVSASWQSDGDASLGGLEVEIKDGIARLKSNGALAGSTLRYNRGLKRIHEITGEPLSAIVATTSWNQATSLGLPNTGKIESGFRADLVILDEDFEVSRTLVGGK